MISAKVYREFLVTFIVNLSSMACGTAIAWTSPVIPKLEDEMLKDTPLDRVPTSTEISWIGPLVPLGAIIAPFITGPLTQRYGRKWILMSISVFFIIAYIIFGVSSSIEMIYFARLLQGVGVGITTSTVPLYVGEIATVAYRGALGSLLNFLIVIGILFTYVIGPYVSYVALQFISISIPIVYGVTFFFMPESPLYFLTKGEKDKAVAVLQYLRDETQEGVSDEINQMQMAVEEATKNKTSVKDLFTNRGNSWALGICVGLMWIQQFSGINVVLFYAQSIFSKAGGSVGEDVAPIIIGIVQVVSCGVTPFVIERMGRKLILLISAGGMAIGMGLLGLYFFLDDQKSQAAEDLSFLPVVSLLIYAIIYSVGFGPIPWSILGELFPPNVKSNASTATSASSWLFAFLITLFFASIDEAIGSHWAFWIFTICCVVGFIFTYFVVFETKGLTAQQIQDKLNGIKSM